MVSSVLCLVLYNGEILLGWDMASVYSIYTEKPECVAKWITIERMTNGLPEGIWQNDQT